MEPWTQFGLVGLICGSLVGGQLWFFRHLLTITFPTMLSTFVSELKNEREARLLQHQDNRADHELQRRILVEGFERLYGRIEKSENALATSLQATRHRIINLETGTTGILEMLKQWRPKDRPREE